MTPVVLVDETRGSVHRGLARQSTAQCGGLGHSRRG